MIKNIATLEQWTEAINSELEPTLNDAELAELKRMHDYVLHRIDEDEKCYPNITEIRLYNFNWDRNEAYADGRFWNRDAREDPGRVNFWLENTSQMLYGFGIFFDKTTRKFSRNSI